jgi:hypothetical protein
MPVVGKWIHGFMDNRYDIFMLKTFFIRFAIMRRLFIMSVVSLNSVILASVPEEVPNGDSRSSPSIPLGKWSLCMWN